MALPHLARPHDLAAGAHLRAVPAKPTEAPAQETLSAAIREAQPTLRARLRLVPTGGDARTTAANGLPQEAGWDEDSRQIQHGWSPPTYLPNRLSPQATQRGIHSVMEFRRRLLGHLRHPIAPGRGLRELIGADASVERVYWEVFGRFGSRRKLVDELVKIVRERYDDLTWQVKQTLDIAQADRQAA